MRRYFIITVLVMIGNGLLAQDNPVRFGVAGLTHTHVHWLLGREEVDDVKIVGIAEPNKDLADRYLKQHSLPTELYFSSLQEMIEKTRPDVVTAFGTIASHLEVVKVCAPRGIHVMVEKPLAVSLEDAREMKKIADKHGIQLLTNYETTWYATNHKSFDLVHNEEAIGPIRKVVVHDGHKGPKEIGVNEEFLEWLIDPKYNGGGAITDFGCYGANLITWLMKGEKPKTVTAITQQIKPETYPEVDDEATIILTYEKAQGIIQASWNWPIARKDMEVYGLKGQILAHNRANMTYQVDEENEAVKLDLAEREAPFHDPFAYFAAIINGEINPEAMNLSSLENNMIVMEILNAAIESAKTGRTIELKN